MGGGMTEKLLIPRVQQQIHGRKESFGRHEIDLWRYVLRRKRRNPRKWKRNLKSKGWTSQIEKCQRRWRTR